MPNYTLSAKITGDSKEYQSAMKQAKSATDELQESADNTGDKIPGLGTKMSSLSGKIKAAAATFGVFKVASSAIEYNASLEQYQTSFEVMTGSADKAADVVAKLKDTAAKTPFEMPQLADTTQLLMNYGMGADDAMSKMSMLGDISQGSAEKMTRIATAYGQMSSAGKVQLEDVKQMIEAGFNPLQEISKSTGESMSSLYDRISKGTISVDEITASMERSTSKGGKYFQSMENQSDTLNGKFSTLKDTVAGKLGAAFEGVSNFLRDTAIPVAIDMLENWDKYEPIVTALAMIIGALTIAYGLNAIGITTLTGSTGIWAGVSSLATTTTTALGGAFTFLTSPITLLVLAITAVIAIGYLLITHWEEVKKIAIDVWTGITQKFTEFDTFLTNIFATDWSKNFGAFGDIMNGFFANVKNIWNSIKQVFNGIGEFISGVFSGNWEQAWTGICDTFGGIFGGIVAIAKSPINGIISLVNAAISGLNKLSVKIPKWVPGVGGQKWGVDLPKIPYLLHGTDDWQGGFARMNEGGRGELTYLPNGTQIIPHDISVQYAKEAARSYNNSTVYQGDTLDGVTILIEHSTIVDSTSIVEKACRYTLKKIGNNYKAVLCTKGV